MKHNNIKKITLLTVTACLLLAVALSVSFAWFVQSQYHKGFAIGTGKIDFDLTAYEYSNNAVTEIVLDQNGNISGGRKYADISDPEKPAIFFLKVQKNEGSIDFLFDMNLYLAGLLSEGLTLTDSEKENVKFLGGYDYVIEKIEDSISADSELDTLKELAEKEVSDEFKALSTIPGNVKNGECTGEKAVYFKVVLKKGVGAENADYTGREIGLKANVVAYQKEKATEADGKTWNIETPGQLTDAVADYQPGDKIVIAQNVAVTRDIVFNRPVNLYVNNGKILTINGNLTFSFNSPEDCIIDTTGGGKIVVRQESNSGGYFKINAPSSKITLKGTNSIDLGAGDIYVQNRVTLRGAYGDYADSNGEQLEKGIVIDGANIYATDSDGNLPKDENTYKDLFLPDGAFLKVVRNTTVGLVQSDAVENGYSVKIHNEGTIKGINLIREDDITTGQIEIHNNGLIEKVSDSEAATHIRLPNWSNEENTVVYRDKRGSEMTIFTDGGEANKFTAENITLFEKFTVTNQKDLLVNDSGNVTVYYYHGLAGTASLESIFNANGIDKLTVKALTVVCPADEFLSDADYTYITAYLKNIEKLDLSDCYANKQYIENLLVGGSRNKPAYYANGTYTYTPKNAFKGMASLKELKLPENTQVIRRTLAEGTKVKDLYLPSTVIACEVALHHTGNVGTSHMMAHESETAFPDVRYVHFTNESVAPQGLGNANGEVSTETEYPIYIVPERFEDECEKAHLNNPETDTLDYDAVWRRRVSPSAIVVEQIVPGETDTVEYLLHDAGNGWEIYYYYNSNTGYIPSVIGEKIYKDTVSTETYKIVGVGEFAFYKVSGDLTSVSCVDTITYIGDCAFQGATIIDFRAENVVSVGKSAFTASSLVTVWMPKASVLSEGAFNENANLKTVVVGRPESWGATLFPGAQETNEGQPVIRVVIAQTAEDGVGIDNFYKTTTYKSNFENLHYVVYVQEGLYDGYGNSKPFADDRTYVIPDAYFDIDNFVLDNGKPLRDVSSDDFVTENRYIGCKIEDNGSMLVGNTGKNINVSDIPSAFTIGGVSLPVVKIGNRAFLGNTVDGAGVTLEIPSAVKVIESRAFYRLKFVDSEGTVKLSAELNQINGYAFRHSNLSTLDLNGNTQLQEIGNYAFSDCTSLIGDFIFPNSLKTMGSRVFYSTRISSVAAESVTSIGSNAFEECGSLKEAVLPKCTSIGERAFYSCTDLAKADLSECTSIGRNAFTSCSSLAEVYLPTTSYKTFVGSKLFDNSNTTGGVLFTFEKVDDNNLTLTNVYFTTSTVPETVTIPNELDGVKVTRIDFEAFENVKSKSVKTLVLPDSLAADAFNTYDGNCMFEGMTAFAVNAANPNFTVKEGVLYDKAGTKLWAYPIGKSETTFDLSDNGVTEFYGGAFSGVKQEGFTVTY